MSYASLMVITKQVPTIDVHKRERERKNQSIPLQKRSNHKGREQERQKGVTKQPANMNRWQLKRPCLIINLNERTKFYNQKTQSGRMDKEKKDLTICCLQKTHFSCKDILRLKAKGQKHTFNVNGSQKKEG